jgi:hypothetical protein
MKSFKLPIRALLTSGAISMGVLAAFQLPAQTANETADGAAQAHHQTRTGMYADRVEARVAQLSAALDLTDSQADQIRTIYLAQHEELRSSAGQRMRDAPLRERREAVFQNLHEQVLAVLTPPQQATYRSLVESGTTTMRGPGSGFQGLRPDGPRGFEGGPRGNRGGFRVAPTP